MSEVRIAKTNNGYRLVYANSYQAAFRSNFKSPVDIKKEIANTNEEGDFKLVLKNEEILDFTYDVDVEKSKLTCQIT